MDDLNKRVVDLEKANKQLMKMVEQLMRRLAYVEKQARTAYNGARAVDDKISFALRELARTKRRDAE